MTTSDADLLANATYGAQLLQVKNTVDAALANAKVVGDQPVGKVSADITTAFKGGTYANGKYAGGERDVREQRVDPRRPGRQRAARRHSRRPGQGRHRHREPRRPAGRAVLRGRHGGNPANTDGVVTYAEANGVLPFVNNVWLVQLTGAQLKQVLEQQWQPTGAERGRSWPSACPTTSGSTQDASKPVGSRITSVLSTASKLDPTKTYTVSTFSFLGTGGDNFTAFKQGTSKDTGLVDRDLWIALPEEGGHHRRRLRPAAGRGAEHEDAASSRTRR